MSLSVQQVRRLRPRERERPYSRSHPDRDSNGQNPFLLPLPGLVFLPLPLFLGKPTQYSNNITFHMSIRIIKHVNADIFPHDLMHVKSLHSCPALRPYGPKPAKLLCPGDSVDKNTGVGCRAFLLHVTPDLCICSPPASGTRRP